MYVHHHIYQHYELLLRHERSLALKQAVFDAVKQGDRVLDAGSGSGLLSVWAAQAGAQVTAVDFIASKLATAIARDNGQSENIDFVQADLEAFATDSQQPYDVLLALLYTNDPRRDERQQKLIASLRSSLLSEEGAQIPDRVRYRAYAIESRLLDICDQRTKVLSGLAAMEGYCGLKLHALADEIFRGAPPASWFPQRTGGILTPRDRIRFLSNPSEFAIIDYKTSQLQYPNEFTVEVTQPGIAHAILFVQELLFQGQMLFSNESISWIDPPHRVQADCSLTIQVDDHWRATNCFASLARS